MVNALKITLEPYRNQLSYREEFPLANGPRRIDCLIKRQANAPPIDLPIAAIFRQYNIIDYKSPHESMNVQNFYKVLSYAYSLPDFFHDDNILTETTISLVSNHYLEKLTQHLKQQSASSADSFSKDNPKKLIEKIIPGLYHIHMDRPHPFPMQIIVLPELPPEDYFWLHCLQRDLLKDPAVCALGNKYRGHKDDPLYQSVLDAIICANITGDKEGNNAMCDALYELFHDELLENWADGKSVGITEGEARGKSIGQNRISQLILKLISDNRNDEIPQMASNPEYCDLLLKQYNL